MTLTDALAAALHNQVVGCKWTDEDEYTACVGPLYHGHDTRLILADPAFREALTAALAEALPEVGRVESGASNGYTYLVPDVAAAAIVEQMLGSQP